MIIAGLQNLSLVDFPGCLASTVFVQGCNFHCGYCHNPDLIPPDKSSEFSEEEVLSYITRWKKMITGVCITGGEPTIYNSLFDFARRVKNLGFRVKLDTNGANPRLLEELFRARLLDYVALDIKTSFSRYSLVSSRERIREDVYESICLVMLSTVPYEFRTTCVPGIIDEKDFYSIGEIVKGADKYCLQQFRPKVTFNKNFQDIKPYQKKDLEKFRDILDGFVKKVEIRGV